MTTGRKKPGVAFWATLVVVVLIVYVLSMGPAAYLMAKIPGDWPMTIYCIVYKPLWLPAEAGPESVYLVLLDYQSWWTDLASP